MFIATTPKILCSRPHIISRIHSDFDLAQSAYDCKEAMAAIARVPYVKSHSLQHPPKNGNCRDAWYISWYKCSLQLDTAIDPNLILYFHYVKMSKSELFEMWLANLSQRSSCNILFPSKPWRGLADFNTESIVCCFTAYATCDLTVLLHNYSNLMLLVVSCRWCDVDVCISTCTSIIAQHTVLFERTL